VRVTALGIAGELMALQGDEAEVAISGKRLRVPQDQLVGLASGQPDAARSARRPGGAEGYRQSGGVWGGGTAPDQRKLDEAVGVSGATPRNRPSSTPGSAPASSLRHRAPSQGATGGALLLTKSIPAEVNLIGMTVEEARERVDKLLDDAALSDRREIRLVHGFGAGKLRKAVAQMLEGHPLVSSWRLGGPSEGGGGATVVELKD
jgi:DNA-nicking Smr family endonuclease